MSPRAQFMFSLRLHGFPPTHQRICMSDQGGLHSCNCPGNSLWNWSCSMAELSQLVLPRTNVTSCVAFPVPGTLISNGARKQYDTLSHHLKPASRGRPVSLPSNHTSSYMAFVVLAFQSQIFLHGVVALAFQSHIFFFGRVE